MQMKYSRHQRGVVTVLVAIALPLLLFIIGMAVDFGHVFVNKTRLQNALDASALSAAIGINADVTHNVAAATAKGIATFNLFKAATGNTELATLNAGSLVFDYSKTLQPWGIFNSTTDKFAFVRVTSTSMLNVTPWLIGILKSADIPIPAIATAGPIGTGYCNIMPIFLCADMSKTCTDGINCYGYKVNNIYSLLQASSSNYTSGNYGLLSSAAGSGANQIQQDLEGSPVASCSKNRSSQTGVAWGPISNGIDYRIDTLDTNNTDYSTSSAYTNYAATGNGSRVMSVAFADCSAMKNGNNPVVPIVGNGCVFINQHTSENGSQHTVSVQYISSCQQSGIIDPNNATLNGAIKIVLFKSPGSSDS
jgi:Flp pilus assembly protein TadG